MVGAHHDHDRGRARSLDLAQNFDSVDAGKNDVQQDEIGILVLKDLQARLAGERGEDLESILPQATRDGAERELFVIDDQSAIWHINSRTRTSISSRSFGSIQKAQTTISDCSRT